jgi:hypothetical protein
MPASWTTSAGDPNLYAYVANDPTDLADPSGEILPIVAACVTGGIVNAGITLLGALGGRKTSAAVGE